MNKFVALSLILIVTLPVKSQVKAVTENGREVTLFNNGTWKFSNDSSKTQVDTITINKNKFARPADARFLVKSNTMNVGVYIDPQKWTFALHKDNESAPEYRFTMKKGDGFAMMVTEKTQIKLPTMRQIAFLNAQKASVDVRETNAEYRIINNKKILCLQFEGTIQEIPFIYLGYYYSNNTGTVQLISYTSQNLFLEIKDELESFLNGLVEISN
jgi:hypothetical protein